MNRFLVTGYRLWSIYALSACNPRSARSIQENSGGILSDPPATGKTRPPTTNYRKDRYAVLTLVLYYGYKHRWSGPLCLKDRVLIPEGTEHMFSDHKINLFQIAYLTREQVNMFKSDFRVVADYFVQKRETGTYVGSQYEMQHVDAVLQLLRVFEKDDRFDTMSQAIVDTEQFKEGESFTMCDVLDMYINQGRDAGLEEGTRTERERIIRTMAADNPDPDLISRLLHLDLSYVQEVMARKA